MLNLKEIKISDRFRTDNAFTSEILDIFSDFIENKEHAIFISSHITSDLEHIADDVIFITQGKIVFDQKLKDIKNDYLVLTVDKDEFKGINRKDIKLVQEGGKLANIAPTIIDLLGETKPVEMTEDSLIIKE